MWCGYYLISLQYVLKTVNNRLYLCTKQVLYFYLQKTEVSAVCTETMNVGNDEILFTST